MSLQDAAAVYPMMEMDDALRRVLRSCFLGSTVELGLTVVRNDGSSSAPLIGCVLARDVIATRPHPSFRAAISDGYAVRSVETGAVLRVVPGSLAGQTAARLDLGECAYLATGAPMPTGADAVVKHEEAVLLGNKLRVPPTKAGTDVRQVGSDFAAGEVLLPRGHELRPWDLGIIASAGQTSATVYSRPRVTVVSTGDELHQEGPFDASTMIHDANRPALLALLAGAGEWDGGALCHDGGVVRDKKDALRRAVLEAADAGSQVLVTTGGVSTGRADVIKSVLEELGTVEFGRLNMKPGKPTTFARLVLPTPTDPNRTLLVFGLPGNPVSAIVTAQLLVVPALRRLRGFALERCVAPNVKATMMHDVTLDPTRPEYRRVALSYDDGFTARDTGFQRSSRLLSMRNASAMAWMPAASARKVLPAGTVVDAILLTPHLEQQPRLFFAAALHAPFNLISTGEGSGALLEMIPHVHADSPRLVVCVGGSGTFASKEPRRAVPGLERAMRVACSSSLEHPRATLIGEATLQIDLPKDIAMARAALGAIVTPALDDIIRALEKQ